MASFVIQNKYQMSKLELKNSPIFELLFFFNLIYLRQGGKALIMRVTRGYAHADRRTLHTMMIMTRDSLSFQIFPSLSFTLYDIVSFFHTESLSLSLSLSLFYFYLSIFKLDQLSIYLSIYLYIQYLSFYFLMYLVSDSTYIILI